jgi:ubiquitin-conjugating enzyme E2 variant
MLLLTWAFTRAALWVTLKVLLCVAIADLLVGLVHWLEDSYGSETWPLIGATVIAPNLLHHAKPRAFLANTYWQIINYQAIAGIAVLAAAWALGCCPPELVLVIVLAVNANEFHRWAHRTRAENGRLISFLQDCKLIQSRAHHGRHHGGLRNTHYCAITPWVDHALDRLRVWRALETAIQTLTGATPRLDPAVAARLA